MSSASLAIEFWLPDRSLAGFVWLGLDVGEYWAALVRVGGEPPYVLVKELEVPRPRRPGSWEIRAEGLWADHNCETPDEHWSFGLEAFGLGFDTAEEALTSEVGDRIALGFDLEWEPGVVHGEILVGREPAIAFDGLSLGTSPPETEGEPPTRRWERLIRGGSGAGTG